MPAEAGIQKVSKALLDSGSRPLSGLARNDRQKKAGNDGQPAILLIFIPKSAMVSTRNP
jgi:hypothetical protein